MIINPQSGYLLARVSFGAWPILPQAILNLRWIKSWIGFQNCLKKSIWRTKTLKTAQNQPPPPNTVYGQGGGEPPPPFNQLWGVSDLHLIAANLICIYLRTVCPKRGLNSTVTTTRVVADKLARQEIANLIKTMPLRVLKDCCLRIISLFEKNEKIKSVENCDSDEFWCV